MHRIASLIAIAAAAFSVCSLGYYLLCLYSAVRFLRERALAGRSAHSTQPLPPVSILKPLKGTDPEMYESLRSHCLQDYPEYEIIFGVSDPHDRAVELVTRLRAEFPQRAIQLFICGRDLGANAKVSNLAQMLAPARYEHLIVGDSDIRVEPDYLRRVMAPLSEPHVGLVTCLYRGIPARTLGSQLESLGISTDFAPGVLAARQLEGGIRFGLGSTLAFRRSDLDAIGGFEALVDYLADDYEIGKRLADRGVKVELSEVVVETFLPAYTLSQFVDHQLRWGRTVRDSRRAGADFRLALGGVGAAFRLRGSLDVDFAGRGYLFENRCSSSCGMVSAARSPRFDPSATASDSGFHCPTGVDGRSGWTHSDLAWRSFQTEGRKANPGQALVSFFGFLVGAQSETRSSTTTASPPPRFQQGGLVEQSFRPC
jgi:ceramide glucosyltransferase